MLTTHIRTFLFLRRTASRSEGEHIGGSEQEEVEPRAGRELPMRSEVRGKRGLGCSRRNLSARSTSTGVDAPVRRWTDDGTQLRCCLRGDVAHESSPRPAKALLVSFTEATLTFQWQSMSVDVSKQAYGRKKPAPETHGGHSPESSGGTERPDL